MKYILATALVVTAASASSNEPLPLAIQKIEAKGAKIYGKFDAPGGLTGYAAEYHNQGMPLYLTPDQKHVIAGTLFDEAGKDLSSDPIDRLVYAPMGVEMWNEMEKTSWILDGKPAAPRIVYLFSDANCPYCTAFWEKARPWVDSGKVQLRHIMIGVIKADSPFKAAALLASDDPQKALYEHEKAGRSSTLKPLSKIPPVIQSKLETNMDLAEKMGVMGTPAVFYLDKDGKLQQHQGAPQDVNDLKAMLGPL